LVNGEVDAAFLTAYGSLRAEREQLLEYLFVREIGLPTVGRADRGVEPLVSVLQSDRHIQLASGAACVYGVNNLDYG